MDLDVIIPFCNRVDLLLRCLRSIELSAPHGFRIILVDDASGPLERAKVDAFLQVSPLPAEVLTHPKNQGFGESIRTGVARAAAPWLIILNSDTIVTPGAFDSLLGELRNAGAVGAVGPVSNNLTDLFQYRMGFGADGARNTSLAGKIAAFARERRLSHYQETTPVPYLTGMCLAVSREVFISAGGFSTDYAHGYFEDLDFSCRLRAMGLRLLACEDSLVYHEGGASYKGDPQRRERLVATNFRIFCSAWGHLPEHGELLKHLDAVSAGEAS